MAFMDFLMGRGMGFAARGPAAGCHPAAPRRFAVDRAQMCDIVATRKLDRLFRQSSRGSGWLSAFYDAAWTASVSQPEFPHFTGPDGMPYFRLDLPDPNKAFDADCLSNLAGHCVQLNSGVAFFACDDDPIALPQFVLPVGVIDAMLRYDDPHGDPIDHAYVRRASKSGEHGLTFEAGARHVPASPSSEFLPAHTVRALHRYMTSVWQIDEPRIKLMVDKRNPRSRHLIIGRKLTSFASVAHAESAMARLLWFMPPGRSVHFMPDHWTLGQLDRLADLDQIYSGPSKQL